MEKLVVLEQSVPPRFFFSYYFSFEPALAGALVPNEKWAIKNFWEGKALARMIDHTK